MKWIKDAFLDIIILGVIVAFSITNNEILRIILWVYSVLLLAGKILYFFVDFLKSKAINTNVPDWFYHSIYLVSIALLIISKDYYLTSVWALIWILSIITLLKKESKPSL